MTEVTMVMPTMGESVMEATIIQWLKQEGDPVAEEESILEVATDKIDSEVPAPYTGRLRQILVQKGQTVRIGAPVAIIATETHSTTPTPIHTPPASTKPTASISTPPKRNPFDHRTYSPLVRHIAQQNGITQEELSQVPGTGQDNRVTKRDLLAYLQHHHDQIKTHTKARPSETPIHIDPHDEIIQLDRIRHIIAERMIASKRSIPHVTSFVEADVTELVAWKVRQKAAFEQKTGIKLTYTPLLLQAVVRTLQDFPMMNSWMLGDRLIKKKAIHIGLAVAMPDGNLVVPVIKHASTLSLTELASQVQTLAQKARSQLLTPDDLTGATYTISNLGLFQNLMGTPIITQPQLAILALGIINKKPAVVASPQGDTIAIRHTMYLSHSYDHRIVDGALGGQFVKQVANYITSFVDWVTW